MSTCFFIGHREFSADIEDHLYEAVERHIVEYGVTDFVVGHYGHFDRLAARVVSDAKKRHPEVSLEILLPYFPPEHLDLSNLNVDNTFYPPDMEKVPKRFAIVRANRYMVDHSEYLIAYVRGIGKSRDVMEYAQRRGKHVENLAEGTMVAAD